MKIGPAIRTLLPASTERMAARAYRRIFVDLRKVAAAIAPELPDRARLLDIGGGDGELLNHLLALRPDVIITMVDVAASVGKFVDDRYRSSVTTLPATSIEQHLDSGAGRYDAALVSDVMHHLPARYRAAFLAAVHSSLAEGASIFVKDVEPGHLVALLGFACDKYLSGDRGVELIAAGEVQALAAAALPRHGAREIGLYAIDAPNYIVQLDFADHGQVA